MEEEISLEYVKKKHNGKTQAQLLEEAITANNLERVKYLLAITANSLEWCVEYLLTNNTLQTLSLSPPVALKAALQVKERNIEIIKELLRFYLTGGIKPTHIFTKQITKCCLREDCRVEELQVLQQYGMNFTEDKIIFLHAVERC